jgi:hypothetical protein
MAGTENSRYTVLLADFSFKELPDDFWNRFQRSRNVRNQIVHEGLPALRRKPGGEDVEENDVANTLAVTREFVHAVKAFRDSTNL